MSTTQQFINRAFRKIGAYDASQTPGSSESDDALSDLNDMLAEWYDEGIKVDDGTLTLTETFPIDGADASAVFYGLCERLLGEYPNERVAGFIMKQARDSKISIRAKYYPLDSVELDDTLTYTKNSYNILIDS